jgi:hypothetical protein
LSQQHFRGWSENRGVREEGEEEEEEEGGEEKGERGRVSKGYE